MMSSIVASGLLSPKRVYLFVSICLLLAISLSVFQYPLYTFNFVYDFWEHSATIREWTKDLWHPRNPHLAIETGSPRYIPFYFVLTVLAKAFDLDPIEALAIGSTLTMVLLLIGVWLFLRLYFNNDWAAPLGLVVFIAGWGVAPYWSNVYQLRCLFYVIPYPSSIAFALSFYSFWLSIRVLRQRVVPIWIYFALCSISAFVLLCHPLTGAFAIGSQCLLALFEPNASFGNRCKLVTVILAGLLAASLWPYFSIWDVIFGTSKGWGDSWAKTGSISSTRADMLYDSLWFYIPKHIFSAIAPALLGLPVLIHLYLRREHLFVVAGFVLMSVPYATNLFFRIPLGHRFLFYMTFFLHLAIVWAILTIIVEVQSAVSHRTLALPVKLKGIVLFSFLIVCLLWNVALAAMEFAGYSVKLDWTFGVKHRHPIVKVMRNLSSFIPDEAIVIAPPRLAWPLPTFAGKVVSLFHVNPMVTDDDRRRRDTNIFFQVETTREQRLKILGRYDITHILYRSDNVPQVTSRDLNSLGSVIACIDNYVIVDVRENLALPPRGKFTRRCLS